MKSIIFILIILLILTGCQEQKSEGVIEEIPSKIIKLNDGDSYTLRAQTIKKNINGKEVMMYGYNGMIPGPLFKVNQGSKINIKFINEIDMDSTVHWHGLRHDNKFDGVPNLTQQKVYPGESFEYKVFFPDDGIYWYHPHVREDFQQDMGLYGNMLSIPIENYYNLVSKEEVLILDDILIEDNGIVEYGKDDTANFAIMGRFGNVMLTNGMLNYKLEVKSGDVIRFYITNVANVRPYNLQFDGAKIKLIGGDIGKYEREEFVDSVVIHPAERYIVEVLFEEKRIYKITNKNPQKTYKLGEIVVIGETDIDHSKEFNKLKENKEIIEDVDIFRKYFDKNIDHEIILDIDMKNMMEGDKNMVMMKVKSNSMMDSDPMLVGHDTNIKKMSDNDHIGSEKIEWEDDMGKMNAISTTDNIKWKIVDKYTGKENMDIIYNWKVGDIKKMRIVNDPDSMHPMQHPIHIHGQRFLVIEQDGVKNDNLVWKDTVAVQTGSTVDILVDVTNPGDWMMHCHIAEHLTGGMMSLITVEK